MRTRPSERILLTFSNAFVRLYVLLRLIHNYTQKCRYPSINMIEGTRKIQFSKKNFSSFRRFTATNLKYTSHYVPNSLSASPQLLHIYFILIFHNANTPSNFYQKCNINIIQFQYFTTLRANVMNSLHWSLSLRLINLLGQILYCHNWKCMV